MHKALGGRFYVAIVALGLGLLLALGAQRNEPDQSPRQQFAVTVANTALKHGSPVHVAISGFPGDARLAALFCTDDISRTREQSSCDVHNVYSIVADRGGRGSREITARRIIETAAAGPIACGIDRDCVLLIVDPQDYSIAAFTPVEFR